MRNGSKNLYGREERKVCKYPSLIHAEPKHFHNQEKFNQFKDKLKKKINTKINVGNTTPNDGIQAH